MTELSLQRADTAPRAPRRLRSAPQQHPEARSHLLATTSLADARLGKISGKLLLRPTVQPSEQQAGDPRCCSTALLRKLPAPRLPAPPAQLPPSCSSHSWAAVG